MGACRASSVTESESVKHRHHRRHALPAWSPRRSLSRAVGSRRKFLSFILSFLKKLLYRSQRYRYLFVSIPRSSLLEDRGKFVGGRREGKSERSEKFQSVCAWQIVETRRGFFFPLTRFTCSHLHKRHRAIGLAGISGARAIVVCATRSCADSCDVSIV